MALTFVSFPAFVKCSVLHPSLLSAFYSDLMISESSYPSEPGARYNQLRFNR